MNIRRAFLLLILSVMSPFSLAGGGVFHLHGRIIESTCSVSVDQTSRLSLNSCSRDVALNAVVATQVVTTVNYTSSWRDNVLIQRTTEPFFPKKQWKETQVVYW